MFSFFKRFKSGGNKAAETSPASPESVESTDSAQPAQATEPTAPAATAGDAKANVASPASHQSTAPTAPATPATPTVSEPVQSAAENTEASDSISAQIPTPDASTTSEPVDVAPPPAPVVVKDAQGETIGEIVAAPAPAPAAKRSWLTRLKTGLSKTSAGLTGIFVGVKVDENLFEELEGALLMSDAGVEATTFLLDALRKKVKAERLTEGEQVKRALHDLLVELLQPLEQSLVLGREAPLVVMIAGVNGAGKTTSIGKLAKHFQHYGQSVLLAAGDTFRAAAREQLTIWGERNNVAVVSQESGDPAAVVFDAVNAARARRIDIVMADTAGRLPTQLHLMEELKKIRRVLGKAAEGAPHEVLLVIDANTGQNALAQVKAFDDALQLTGLIVTKLDGTAKGGILAAIARQRPVPVYFIGVGEKVEDLQPFSAREFADALLG
ncbi:signal recognition particle-docking protein FtsY [Pandoraea pulmonicola]|uniref:Signal recognition particle receptor FtsY n=1 Tax=Pandoraea pulmonicola TaxID=93221 RepID=A0AAJ5D0H0_PANPU|nr:signal recognition particle-docking protein FtsY [Pandoraea pulmonicola]AJC20887.1 signal recognition particle-docking protein FtsY [Pandoraea pulmonicola]SUA90545.1 Cell division protein FtsY homolog [Pandoraea pulmonicola]